MRRQGCVERLESKPAGTLRSRFAAWPRQLGAIAAGLLLTLSVGYGLGRWSGNGDSRIEQEVAAAHVRSLQADHLVDVASSDRHTVKPWFAGKIDFAPIVADFAGQGFALVGGRLDYLDGRPAAALVFKRREHLVNVFLQPRRDGDAPTPHASEQHGFHLLHAVVGGFDCWFRYERCPRELRYLLGSTDFAVDFDIPSTAMYDAGMNLSKDLVAASASPLVLSLLEDGESYGYAIIQRVRELTDGEIEWTDGMLYPVLYRLEAMS